MHGAAATARYFSRKLKHPEQESIIKSILKAVCEEATKRRRRGDTSFISLLPQKKHGRGLLHRRELDTKC